MESEFEILKKQIESVHFSIMREIEVIQFENRDNTLNAEMLKKRVIKIEEELRL